MPRFLSTAETPAVSLLKCGNMPLGKEVVYELHQHPVDARLVKGSALALQERVQTLLDSQNEKHKHAITRINEVFQANDQEAFNQTAPVEQRLGETAILEWLKTTSSSDIVSFAQWNNDRQTELMFALDDDHDALVEASLEKVKNLIALGFFPKNALDAMHETSKDLAIIRPIDSFEAGARGAVGSYNTELGIALKNLYADPTSLHGITPELMQVMFHELLHATGHTNGMGFTFGQGEDSYGRLWEEAFVSHAASVAFQDDKPQLNTYDPRARADGSQIYKDERRVLDIFSREDIGNISPDVWATAFFSKYGTPGHLDPAFRLQRAFNQMENSAAYDYISINEAYEATWLTDDGATRTKIMQNIIDRAVYLLNLSDDTIYEDIKPSDTTPYELVEQSSVH